MGLADKAERYCGAVAVVYPIAFDEPFGLVLAEALAFGTPVMAFERGSIAEIISDGETGIIGRTVDDLVNRFSELASISGEKCRGEARARFSKERMVEEYLQLFKKLCQQQAR